jgi:4-amino-4-deoxy-L-arabinose transferase-like glycosyltransferase
MNSALRARVGVVVCLLVGAALRFWRLGAAPLIGDEAYYWLWSRHLDWAYLDHPAGIALLIRVSTWLGGEGELGIRWLNALFGVALIPLAYALMRRMASPFAATLAAAIVALAPPLIVVSRWVYTDTLLLLLLMAHLLVLTPLLTEASGSSSSHVHSPKRYVILAVLTALLMNTKYTVALYLGGVALMALADPRLRRDGRLWLALGLGCLGAAPVVAWNATHGWLSFRWQFAHLVHGSGHVASRLGAIAHLIRYLTPPVCLLAAIGVGAWADTGPHRRVMRRMVFLGLLLALPAVLSPANSPRNTIAGVTLLLLASAATIDRWRLGARPNSATAVSAAFVLLMAAYALGTVWAGLAPTSLPRSVIADTLRRETLGWRGVRLDPAPPTTEELLLTIDYDLAGKLRYYGGYAAYTSWPQYRLWGIPDLADAQIVALDYLDPAVVTERLDHSFHAVEGPTALTSADSRPRLLRWRAQGRTVDLDTLLERLDYRRLSAEAVP